MHDWTVLKAGDLFLVSAPGGDVVQGRSGLGLFTRDTQYLDRYELSVGEQRPEFLSASPPRPGVEHIRCLTQVPASMDHVTMHHAPASLLVERMRHIAAGVFREEIRLIQHGEGESPARVTLRFGGAFRDIFEVRGLARPRRGELLPPRVRADAAVLGYVGLDGVRREVELLFDPAPALLTAQEAVYDLVVPGRGTASVRVQVRTAENGRWPAAPVAGQEPARPGGGSAPAPAATVADTADAGVNAILARSLSDMQLLLTDLGHGPLPAAGVPWFVTLFGRDSMIAAMQMLAFDPAIARATLRTLAACQGVAERPQAAEQPGKILHELRVGEMARLGEVPFGRYYGSVDATPLFLILYGEYFRWTADRALAEELLPAVRRALAWIDGWGDADGDGFVEYVADSGGLVVQTWKDSANSMVHRNGKVADSPLAVCEVQGYVYAARRAVAGVVRALGDTAWAERLAAQAADLRRRFNAAFWMADPGYLALALDHRKQQVGSISSDPGHCLWCGIVDPERAEPVARRLVAPDMFSGWGVRTLSRSEPAYNPISYHNGSVWPHDTALCALGLKRYGFWQASNSLAAGLLEAAAHFPHRRLPELFCGFDRSAGPPVPYPVSCSPQAWAAGTPPLLLQAMLGLNPDAPAGRLYVSPTLPDWLPRVTLCGLRVGQAVADLSFSGHQWRVERLAGELEVTDGQDAPSD